MTLAELDTPCLLVDGKILDRNVARMHERMRAGGVPLRPHLKTTKCVEIARRMTEGQPGGVAVSTLAEAQRFAAAGFRDILYAVVIAPKKLDQALSLRQSGVDLILVIDNVDIARLAGAAAARCRTSFSALIEVDVDSHRSGVPATPDALLPLGRALSSVRGLELRGLMTHAGSAYDCDNLADIAAVAALERTTLVRAARWLREAGLSCEEVSVGSTPTALAAGTFQGVTEVRAGVFPFNDLMQTRLGTCTTEDIAISVLCTVIGHHASERRLLVDAGWTALSQESLPYHGRTIHGLLCDLEGRLIEDFVLTNLNQEHGIVTRLSGGPIDSGSFPVGTALRILPVHACATAAAHERYHVIKPGTLELESWPRFGGWGAGNSGRGAQGIPS